MISTGQLWVVAVALLGVGFLACDTTPIEPPPVAGETAEPPVNIVVIVIDGMRADRAHHAGNPNVTTPTLDLLAAHGVSFDFAFSQSNESALSHASLFTGRYPSEVAFPEYLDYRIGDSATLLPEMLQAYGYRTAAFTAGGHVKAGFGFEQGYDRYYEHESYGSFFDTVPRALGWLDEGTEPPFYLFLHGYDCHRPFARDSLFFHPFGPGEGVADDLDAWIHRRNFTEKTYHGVYYPQIRFQRGNHVSGESLLDPGSYLELDTIIAGQDPATAIPLVVADLAHLKDHYDSGLLTADTYVGLFVEGLIERGLWDNTLLIVTSDHGEDLQDHGYSNHRAVVHDSTTRVPLLFSGGAVPADQRGTRRSELTDALDLVATAADVAGAVPPASSRGRSLWALLQGEETAAVEAVFQQGVLGQTSARTADHRLVFNGFKLTDQDYGRELAQQPIDGGHFQLFHSAVDATEQHDVIRQQGATAEALREQMVRWYGQLHNAGAGEPPDPALREMLHKHGYWEP